MCFDLGTEPIANKILNEIYAIQEKYKAREPWLLPEPEPKAQKVEASPSSQKKVVRKTNDSKKTKSSINIKKNYNKKIWKIWSIGII